MIHLSPMACEFVRHQTRGKQHPLTCRGGGGPCPGVLLVLREDHRGWLLLGCPRCDFTQRLEARAPLGRLIFERGHALRRRVERETGEKWPKNA